jgi:hypothetical protein
MVRACLAQEVANSTVTTRHSSESAWMPTTSGKIALYFRAT